MLASSGTNTIDNLSQVPMGPTDSKLPTGQIF